MHDPHLSPDVSADNPLRLVLSIDVEEEGLFSQEYQCTGASVRNVAHLSRLIPLIQETGVPVTLFCAHAVFADAAACRVVARMRDHYGAEIGAHLHHWNTPPAQAEHMHCTSLRGAASVSTALVPVEVMQNKLSSLFSTGQDFQGAPLTSFRMGRWDLRQEHWYLLAEVGVRADASVRPLHCATRAFGTLSTAPDHFLAPREPYWVGVGERSIFELPLTTSPLLPFLPRLAEYMATSSLGDRVRAGVQSWGALTLLPAYQPLWLLQLCTWAHVLSGGRTLSLTWHSSEMQAKGAPHMPTEQAVDAFMTKMLAYVRWLQNTWPVEALTLQDLRTRMAADSCPTKKISVSEQPADWRWIC